MSDSPDDLAGVPSDHRILLAVQKQKDSLIAEKVALQGQIDGLVAERDALRADRGRVRSALSTLIDEAERVVLAEVQASGHALPSLQWAIDRGRTALESARSTAASE